MAAYMCSLAKWPVQRQDAYCTAYMRACNIKVANTLVTLNSCEHNPTQLVKKIYFLYCYSSGCSELQFIIGVCCFAPGQLEPPPLTGPAGKCSTP